MPTTRLLVSAPVGQETMHSPQETHVESAHGQVRVEGDAGVVALAAAADHVLSRISSQPRMQRSHRMQAS